MAQLLKLNSLSLQELKNKAQALPISINTADATATSDDIITNKTAYVDGVKVVGNNPYEKQSTDQEIMLQENIIIEIVNLLQEKAMQGCDIIAKNCIVTISCNKITDISYTSVENGVVAAKYIANPTSPIKLNCLRGSSIVILLNDEVTNWKMNGLTWLKNGQTLAIHSDSEIATLYDSSISN